MKISFLLISVLAFTACTSVGSGGTTTGTAGSGTSTSGSSGGRGGALCSGDGQCSSGQCLGGRCCGQHCQVPDGSCGANACLPDGGCNYPGPTVACGGGTCDVSNHFTPPQSCDGAGMCGDTGLQYCGEFTCLAGIGCPDHCIDDTVCFPGKHCFPKQKICCPPIASGATVYVDCVAGSDTGCCGSGPGAAACLTLTAAMDVIDRSHATGTTLTASVDGGTGDWTAPETWPVTLHRGVTLTAPGIFFFVPDPSHYVLDVFDVIPADSADHLPVTLQGEPGAPIYIGFDRTAQQTMNTYDGLLVRGLTAKAKSLWIGGSANGAQVEDNGILEIDGPVRFGNYRFPGRVDAAPSSHGIVCEAFSASAPATIIDPGAADGDLIIQGQIQAGIYVQPNCNVTLTHRPVFGEAPIDGGCPSPKADTIGILVDADPAQVTLSGAVFQCMQVDGVQLIRGTAQVTLDNATVTHCGCTGLRAFAGTIYSNGGLITQNYWGVAQEGGQIILSGGGTGGVAGGNTIGCNTESEPGACFGSGIPGVDVVNEGSDPLAADNCLFDHQPPSEFGCTDSTFASCSCLSAPSTPCALDSLDLATTNTGTISTTGSGTNTLGCTK